MRLGFHYHIPAIEKNGNIYMPGYQGRFVDSLAFHCEELICFLHTPRKDEEKMLDYIIQSPNVKLIGLGIHSSIPKRKLIAYRSISTVRKWKDHLDVMLIRGPSPLLPELAGACQGLPLFLLIVGDYLAGVDDLPQPRWRKEAIRLWSWWNARQQLKVAKRSVTFVNSHMLFDQLSGLVPNLFETRTTTLTMNDFYSREDTCLQPPYHLLFTGRIDRAKGLFEIIEALSQLITNGFDVVLDLVGMPAKGDSILSDITVFSRSLGIEDRVRYHGYKSTGPELLNYYRQADIFVTASRTSEGFPRTIWEAMASSMPVVATRVGSIPDYIEDASILVPPKQVGALTIAITKLLTDDEFRKRLIQKGMAIALENTLEKRAEEMVSQIENWLDIHPEIKRRKNQQPALINHEN